MTLTFIQPKLVDDKLKFIVEEPCQEKSKEEVVEEMAKKLVELNLQRFFLKKCSEMEKNGPARSFSR